MLEREMLKNLSSIKKELGQLSFFEKKTSLINLIKEQLVKLIGDTPEIEELDIRKTFLDLGMDSLLAIQFKALLEKKLEIILSPKIIYQYNTSETLAEYLVKQI